MAYKPVITEARNGAMWITLNRPEAMNAITPEIVQGINHALDRVEADETLRAVVLTGAGDVFCAGADLKFLSRFTSGDSAGFSEFLGTIHAAMERLERFPFPAIAAINGLAVAGGLELVLCCDLVVAARSARIGDAHANYGLLPGGGGSVRLPRKIGPARAKYLLYTGAFVSAESMAEAGLVNIVADDGDLVAETDRLVESLAAKSPLVLSRMKTLVDDGLEQPSETALRLERLAGEVHSHSHDMKEGIAAFGKKRRPAFKGR